jgi:SAM-dependent methyltransferase
MPNEPAAKIDQDYLLTKQYQNEQNLRARIRLHELFSVDRVGWHRWVFDHLIIPQQARGLELGCGPGDLWVRNRDRIPVSWEITLSDFSPGMLEQARVNLQRSDHPFTYAQIDAQAIPYEDGYFDAVIANHMLYHVPDRAKALAEIRRVLKAGGRFYAATNGKAHMAEIKELVLQFDPDAGSLWKSFAINPFRLENGGALIAQSFDHVTLHVFEDRNAGGLEVTEAGPFVDYVLSTPVGMTFDAEKIRRFTAFIQQQIDERGAIHITKATGLFEAF